MELFQPGSFDYNRGTSIPWMRNAKVALRAGRYVGKRVKKWLQENTPESTPNTTRKRKSVAQEKTKSGMSGPYAVKRSKANALVNKVSMSVKGKTKVKKTKKVRVSSKFRAGVKQVMSGLQARGTFVTVRQGLVGSYCRNGAPGTVSLLDMGQTNPVVLFPGTTLPVGARTLWNALCVNNPGAAFGLNVNSGLNFFTPAKVLDAASVLFNKKPIGNPYSQVGNLSEIVTTGGLPVNSTPTLKINILDSSVRFTMKNISNRVVTVEIWECTPTIKFSPANALATLEDANIKFVDSGTLNPVTYYGTPAGTEILNTVHETNFDPFGLAKKYMGLPFTWKKRVMVMNPEETCTHWIKGPKGIMDFRKLTSVAPDGTNITNLDPLCKGFSVSVVMGVYGDQVLKPAAQSAGGRENYTLFAANTVTLGMPVSVEVEERYRIAVPEITGYVTANGVAGTAQALNLRKNRYVMWNQNGAQVSNEGVGGYSVSNEENPLAEGTTGAQYQ